MAPASLESDHQEKTSASDQRSATALARRSVATSKFSEEFEPYLKSLPAKTGIEACNHAFLFFQSESKSGRGFHFGQTDFAGTVKNFTGIGEQDHIEAGVYLPEVLQ